MRAGALDVIEIDRDVIPALTRRCADRGELRVHVADALEFDFRALRGSGAKLRLVGNLPYNISTPLLFRLIEQIDAIADMHFMLQKEVVERMAARPGTRDYGRLTVMLAPHVRVRPLFDIGTGAFTPPPRVQSTFLRSNRCPSRRSRSATAPPSRASSPRPSRSAARRCATPCACPGRRDGDRGRRHRPRRPARDARPRRIRRARRALPVLSRERVVARPAHHIIRPSGLPGRPCANIRRSCSAWT